MAGSASMLSGIGISAVSRAANGHWRGALLFIEAVKARFRAPIIPGEVEWQPDDDGVRAAGRAIIADCSDVGAARCARPLSSALHGRRARLPVLANSGGDNDSLLRLVEVRDLARRAGLVRPHQDRMGCRAASDALVAPGGRADRGDHPCGLGVTGATQLAKWLPGSCGRGAHAAALFLLLRLARRIGGEEVALPALLVGASRCTSRDFSPGALDHHNLQLLLTLGALCCSRRRPRNRSAWWAGVSPLLMLGVGMETAPLVAVAGCFVADWFLSTGAAADTLRGFGLGFAATSALVLVADRRELGRADCDAFSLPQSSLGSSEASAGRHRRRASLEAQPCDARRVSGAARCGCAGLRRDLLPAVPRRPLCRPGRPA